MSRELHTFATEGFRTVRPRDILLGIGVALLLLALLFAVEAGGYLPGVPVGMSLAIPGVLLLSGALLARNEKRWLLTVILALAIFVFRDSEAGRSALDVLFGLYVNGGLVLWFVKELLIFRRPILRSRFDLYYLSVLLLCLVTSTTASLLHGMQVAYALGEFSGFLLFFFYFPFRNILREERDVLHVFLALLALGLVNGAMNVMNYQQRVIESAMTFGEVNARSALNEPLSAILFCGFFILVAASRSIRMRLLGLLGVSLFAGLLVLSLSRGPIASALIGSFAGLLLIYPWRLPRMVVAGVVALVVNIGAAFILLPDFASSIFENISSRFETIERLGGDQSFNARFAEYESLYTDYIPASPVIGYGFGVNYHYYNAIFETTYYPIFTHSGYLHALFKFGIPAGLLLLSLFFIPLLRFPYASVRTWSPRRRMVYAWCFGSMVTMMIINVTSNTITYYTEILYLAVLLATFDYLYRSGDDPLLRGPAGESAS